MPATSSPIPTHRQVFRTTNTGKPTYSEPLLQLVSEELPSPIPPRSVLIKVHAISLNSRDGNITRGTNPWPVLPHIVPCSDAVGEVIGIGADVKQWKIGDRVMPILDLSSITGREQERTWLAADVDGVLATHVVFDENLLVRVPKHLTYEEASVLPCAGVTAWSAVKDLDVGGTMLVQGTGGVSMIAIKLALARGCRVIVSSGSKDKIERVKELLVEQFPGLAQGRIQGVSYKNEEWDEDVLKLTRGVGVDLVLDNGGTGSIVRSLRCTRRGGIISQVGYLGKQDAKELEGMVPILIDRKVNLRGINVGSKHDFEDLNAAIAASQMQFTDIIDRAVEFEEAEQAIEYVRQGKQLGKVVMKVEHEAEYQG